jgi:hypothetical protein
VSGVATRRGISTAPERRETGVRSASRGGSARMGGLGGYPRHTRRAPAARVLHDVPRRPRGTTPAGPRTAPRLVRTRMQRATGGRTSSQGMPRGHDVRARRPAAPRRGPGSRGVAAQRGTTGGGVTTWTRVGRRGHGVDPGSCSGATAWTRRAAAWSQRCPCSERCDPNDERGLASLVVSRRLKAGRGRAYGERRLASLVVSRDSKRARQMESAGLAARSDEVHERPSKRGASSA